MRRRSAAILPLGLVLALASALVGYVVARQQAAPAQTPAAEQPPSPALAPSPAFSPAPSARSIIPANAEATRVKSVTDGDTITLEDGRKVRYIGIDTPERAEPYYDDASKLNASFVSGRTVHLEFDVEKQDNYKRLLAYVYVRLDGGEERLVNAELVRSGLARLYTFPPNVRHVEALRACQKEAIGARRGTWKDYVFNSEPYFVATPNGRAFHRPSCRHATGDNLIRYNDARDALDAGKSSCRTCKP